MSAVARKTIRERENQAGQMIATRIRELRKKYGFSLRVLADISGLNVNTLSLIENGRNLPSVSTLTFFMSRQGMILTTDIASPLPGVLSCAGGSAVGRWLGKIAHGRHLVGVH